LKIINKSITIPEVPKLQSDIDYNKITESKSKRSLGDLSKLQSENYSKTKTEFESTINESSNLQSLGNPSLISNQNKTKQISK